MKKCLILLVMVVFTTVSCVGQQKWTKPDFRQDDFERDREECLQAVKNDPQATPTLEQCLAKKGYESDPERSPDNEKSKTAEVAKAVGKGLLITALAIVAVAALAAYVALSVLGGL